METGATGCGMDASDWDSCGLVCRWISFWQIGLLEANMRRQLETFDALAKEKDQQVRPQTQQPRLASHRLAPPCLVSPRVAWPSVASPSVRWGLEGLP